MLCLMDTQNDSVGSRSVGDAANVVSIVYLAGNYYKEAFSSWASCRIAFASVKKNDFAKKILK